MKLPTAHGARVDRGKITEYLLSATHPQGHTKARFFTRFGFTAATWPTLAIALKELAAVNAVSSVVETPFGVRYTVDGNLRCPDGRAPTVRTVWIVEHTSAVPRLVTAHPL